MKRINKQGGFTLLELLVVVAIIAIIAGAVISAISGQEERAGQGVALHTMGALENSIRQFDVLNSGLPSSLDSLVCAGLADTTNTGQVTAPTELGTNTEGGLADGLAAKVDVAVLANAGAAMNEAGITSLRYADTTGCDDTEDNLAAIDLDNDGGTDTPANDSNDEASEVLANTLFWDADQGGVGADVPVVSGESVPVALLLEPDDIGQSEESIIGVFGVGNFTQMSSNEDGNERVLSRGPVDGNVDGEGERYSHFSVAIKLGELAAGTQATVVNAAGADSDDYEADEIDVVAILDSDGDNFDDEVAEFAGLEDE